MYFLLQVQAVSGALWSFCSFIYKLKIGFASTEVTEGSRLCGHRRVFGCCFSFNFTPDVEPAVNATQQPVCVLKLWLDTSELQKHCLKQDAVSYSVTALLYSQKYFTLQEFTYILIIVNNSKLHMPRILMEKPACGFIYYSFFYYLSTKVPIWQVLFVGQWPTCFPKPLMVSKDAGAIPLPSAPQLMDV